MTQKLIARIEAARGPDRALDWEIHLRDGLEGVGMYGRHPSYTASIDAALTLMEKGWHWALGWNGPDSGHPNATASVFTTSGAMEKGAGATPALALCAAALKARLV